MMPKERPFFYLTPLMFQQNFITLYEELCLGHDVYRASRRHIVAPVHFSIIFRRESISLGIGSLDEVGWQVYTMIFY